MAYREVHCVEIREVIRRWQAGLSQRRIAAGTGVSRPTVRRYIAAAEAAGLRPGGPEPSEQQLAQLATLSRTGPAPGGGTERAAALALGGADRALAAGRAPAGHADP